MHCTEIQQFYRGLQREQQIALHIDYIFPV